MSRRIFNAIVLYFLVIGSILSQDKPTKSNTPKDSVGTFVIGQGDLLSLHVADMEEFSGKQFRVEQSGDISLPVIGRIKAAGLGIASLELEVENKLRKFVLHPKVSINVIEVQSRPVSVMGAVSKPGVIQVSGRQTLLQLLAQVGGLSDDAGHSLTVVRPVENGKIPLENSTQNKEQTSYQATIQFKNLLNGRNPLLNIDIYPNDSISVPRADYVYVVGEVHRAGGFPMNEGGRMSLLQAIALAGGIQTSTASASKTVILHRDDETSERKERVVDIRKALKNDSQDFDLQAGDIVYVPQSTGKKAALRAIEAAIQTGSGIAIFSIGRTRF